MNNRMNIQAVRPASWRRLSGKFSGTSPEGREVGFNNYYMLVDGKPFFGISGECHYSRVPEEGWEDTILKMKAGGINTVATYVFWNHHEEVEGQFRFDGRRNLRRFIELCGKHGMLVILRCGPFDHGEVRNGGFPDWLYGKPFDVRSSNEGFLHCVRLLYRAIAGQVKGLFWKDGGPIIAAQVENEYMHSASPWEWTTGVSNEWIGPGRDGNEYMYALNKIMQEEGILTPFYTCTAWGGAAQPTDEMLPLWGGYAYWPWMFYRGEKEPHPVTPEYLYRDYHNNQVPATYNFEPDYQPEYLPYACCEMGGGMQVCYHYRFRLSYASVDAMANIKLAGGCNFLGYYMYKGGNNPRTASGIFLNESQCPKISYDYQAPVGEFGQLRPSWYRLRTTHLFLKHFGESFCDLVTVLPENAGLIDPADQTPLRYAVRTDGKRGFLFLNNYQDHVQCEAKANETVTLETAEGAIVFDNISLAAEESAILPFRMDLDGVELITATAQPLSVIRKKGKSTFFFFTPEGMRARYTFADGSNVEVKEGENHSFTKDGIEIVTLSRAESFRYYEVTAMDGETVAILSERPLIADTDMLHIEETSEQEQELAAVPCGQNRYTLTIPQLPPDAKEVLLRIDYTGDIGSLFTADGELLEDNFSNEDCWETGLVASGVRSGDVLTLYITPRREDVHIDVSSVMAGRHETAGLEIAGLRFAALRFVKEIRIPIGESASDLCRTLECTDGIIIL